MQFPRTIDGRTFDDAPSLAAAVRADAEAGQRPSIWLMRGLTAQEIERPLAVALCAALVRGAHPPSVLEAAALAQHAELHELAPVFRAALAGLDVGVLLHPDPQHDGASVEDALLRAWARVEPGEPARTVDLFDRLQHAGLRDVELATLSRLGDADAIRERLPPILVEQLPVEDVESLASALARGGDVARAVCDAAIDQDGAGPLNAAQRYAVWRAAVALDAGLANDGALQARWLVVEGGAVEGGVN